MFKFVSFVAYSPCAFYLKLQLTLLLEFFYKTNLPLPQIERVALLLISFTELSS